MEVIPVEVGGEDEEKPAGREIALRGAKRSPEGLAGRLGELSLRQPELHTEEIRDQGHLRGRCKVETTVAIISSLTGLDLSQLVVPDVEWQKEIVVPDTGRTKA